MIAIRLRRLYRRLSYFTAFLRDFRPGMQTFIPLPFAQNHAEGCRWAASLALTRLYGRKTSSELQCLSRHTRIEGLQHVQTWASI